MEVTAITLHIILSTGTAIAFVERCDALWSGKRPKRRGSLWSVGFLAAWLVAEVFTFGTLLQK